MSKLFNICKQCKKKVATNGELCNICIEDNNKEYEKCLKSPFYYVTKYMQVNGKPFTTLCSEEVFNKTFNAIYQNFE